MTASAMPCPTPSPLYPVVRMVFYFLCSRAAHRHRNRSLTTPPLFPRSLGPSVRRAITLRLQRKKYHPAASRAIFSGYDKVGRSHPSCCGHASHRARLSRCFFSGPPCHLELTCYCPSVFLHPSPWSSPSSTLHHRSRYRLAHSSLARPSLHSRDPNKRYERCHCSLTERYG